MYYINQIQDLLNCSRSYAVRIFDNQMSHLDLSEMSQETFEMEVSIATMLEPDFSQSFCEANEGNL